MNLIKLIRFFQYEGKFTVSVEGEMYTPREIQAGIPQGSVLSPIFICIIDTPRHQVFIWPSLPVTLICILQIAKRVMFSENCSAVSIQLRHSVNAGTLKSMKIKLGLSTSLTDLDHLRFT
jgi:hypothetical protein